ncbi:MAG: type I-U CRISPR-associated protein Cas5/Cas6 [Pirellulaceae bacterium]|nr:type I-U CRISPR-associated protein Cas5/Cas6 [Pirellulaceae bacterium]
MSRILLISVRLHDGRYHGAGEGPPAPARLFQALVAGAGLGGPLQADVCSALQWLEELDPPIIGTPRLIDGQSLKNFVPNNDLDAVGGDQRRTGKIRTQKAFKPRLFDAEVPWLFAWRFTSREGDERQAQRVCSLAEQVYQFGCGIDLAWAWGEVLEDHEVDERLAAYAGLVYRPSAGGEGIELTCPQVGSLRSLSERHQAFGRRFQAVRQGRSVKQLFSQPTKPRFAQIAYDSPTIRHVYELREPTSESLVAWPLSRVVRLVEAVRDAAVARLRNALPAQRADIERFLVGRKADGSDEGPTELRVRILPLPSIGVHHADREIRRVAVEVAPGCPLRAEDVRWALSGVELVDGEGEHSTNFVVTPATDQSMLRRFGVGEPATVTWRTVTPIALPEPAIRRRIDPARQALEPKGGAERAGEQCAAAEAIVQALRHARVPAQAQSIRVQREPFEAKGLRVESFAPGTRFAKERLWHAEITFRTPVAGPLVLGCGRFLGLGLMRPVPKCVGVLAFAIVDGLTTPQDPTGLTRSLRRAVMARVQAAVGLGARLPAYFTGHEHDGSVAHSEQSPHLACAFDPLAGRLLVIAPHLLDHRPPMHSEADHWRTLEESLADLSTLRAGQNGILTLRRVAFSSDADPLFATARNWRSVTPYQVTRHAKGVGATTAFATDMAIECQRRGLPVPQVKPIEIHGERGLGLIGHAALSFTVAVNGPLLIGKNRHFGGGLFVPTAASENE